MKILLIVAHSDDQVLGPGGAVAHYAEEGAEIKTIIFSYGELTHPHYKPEVIRDARREEADKADKILGGSGVEFLAVPDGQVTKLQEDSEAVKRLRTILKDEKPDKIFTHAKDEAHPDHVAVHRLVLAIYDKLHNQRKLTCEIYSFGIWRFFKFKSRNKPRLIIDISDTFTTKLKALKVFRSQTVAMLTLTWSVYVKAIWNGLRYGKMFVEVFYKLR